MTPKEFAEKLYYDNYMILFDSDSDKGEEILISLLSKKLAIKFVDTLINENINILFFKEVKNCLNQIN